MLGWKENDEAENNVCVIQACIAKLKFNNLMTSDKGCAMWHLAISP